MEKSQYDYYNTFLTIDIDPSMKYKRDIPMKYKVPSLPLQEHLLHILPVVCIAAKWRHFFAYTLFNYQNTLKKGIDVFS